MARCITVRLLRMVRSWYNEDVHDHRSVETEFPAIVFNDALTPEVTLSCEPTVRILQKSQENGQNRTNTDTGTDRVHKSLEFLAK
ncbi:hypothetical protein Tco_1451899, partial [Tanacetum coccineum]